MHALVMTDNNTAPWQGLLQLAPDFVLMQGAVGATSAHAHFAHQFLWAPTQQLHLRVAGKPFSGTTVFIPSLQPHEILAPAHTVFTVFAEPLTFPGDALQQALSIAEPSMAGLAEAVQSARQASTLDARLDAALSALDAVLAEKKVSAHELARHANLSLSQLERLFSAQIGLPVRRLVLWRRLRLAVMLALRGEALTMAAHHAGFSDAAHFSRTMRQMFGVRADQALRGLHIDVLD